MLRTSEKHAKFNAQAEETTRTKWALLRLLMDILLPLFSFTFKVLGEKMSRKADVNGLANSFKSMDCASNRPPSLFSCQVKLFNDWFSSWSGRKLNEYAP